MSMIAESNPITKNSRKRFMIMGIQIYGGKRRKQRLNLQVARFYV
jgi:hypothetical protein